MSRHAEDIQQLRQAVRSLSGCESIRHDTVIVETQALDNTLHQLVVQVFSLIGHPDTRLAYAWRDTRRPGDPYIAVLGVPPIYTARDAVNTVTERAPILGMHASPPHPSAPPGAARYR